MMQSSRTFARQVQTPWEPSPCNPSLSRAFQVSKHKPKISSFKNPHIERETYVLLVGQTSLKPLYSIMNVNTTCLPWYQQTSEKDKIKKPVGKNK